MDAGLFQSIICISIAFTGVILIGIQFSRRADRAERLARDWAARENLVLTELIPAFFIESPFNPFGSQKSDHVFKMAAARQDGERLEGWLRCTTARGGRYAGRVDVKWNQSGGFPVVPIKQEPE